MQYYHHASHLGSASYITNLDGEVVQHIEYTAWGEVFIEERNNTWNTPYLFNGKELDEETGLYYYGARYYNPRISLWYGVDPMAEKYPDFSPYAYTFNNPVKFVDPDGKEGWPANNRWTMDYVNQYSAFAKNKLKEWRNSELSDDCANFAFRLIIEFASTNELPLTLESAQGVKFESSADKYTSTQDYIDDVTSNLWSNDILTNTYGVDYKDTKIGDIGLLKYNEANGGRNHTVIYSDVKADGRKNRLVYGNLPAETLKENYDWTRYSSKTYRSKFDIYRGGMNNRWNILNPNLYNTTPLERLQSKPIELLPVPNITPTLQGID